MTRLVFFPGPPRLTDLNYVSRVFGKTPGGAPMESDRAIRAGSSEHFRAAALAWLLKHQCGKCGGSMATDMVEGCTAVACLIRPARGES
jgi:hypothetical protein